ncbi:MAG: hypothetical protein ACI4GO_03920 [Hominenteromicrobium sp.]
MREWIWAAAAVAAFGVGCIFIRWIDCLLRKSHRAELRASGAGGSLRLGFSDPMAAAELTEVLEKYSGHVSGAAVQLFGGSAQELLCALSDRRLDVIFLPESVKEPQETYFNIRHIRMARMPVFMKYGGLPIGPIAGGAAEQQMVWLKADTLPQVQAFIRCLQDKIPAQPVEGGKKPDEVL